MIRDINFFNNSKLINFYIPFLSIFSLFFNFLFTKIANLKLKYLFFLNLIGYVLIFLFMLRTVDLKNIYEFKSIDKNDTALLEWIEISSKPSDIFLISNYKSKSFLNEYNFEIYAHRPSLVNWKFVPISSKHLIDWYKNIIRKKNFFDDPCNIKFKLNFNYILINDINKKQLFRCYQSVYENDDYLVYKVK